MYEGSNIWELVKIGYTKTTNPPIDQIGKKLEENNAKVMNAIFPRLVKSEFVKVM